MEINPAQRAGKLLRMMREEARLTQAELAKLVHISAAMISYFETGNKPARADLVERLDNALNANGKLIEIWGFTTDNSYSAELLASQEAEATEIHDWEGRLIPGLLQTPAYAHEVTRASFPRATEDEIAALVTKRIERQRVIFDRINPPVGWFVIDEGVLYRGFGGEKPIMREQLDKLEIAAAQPNIFIQIMRFSAVHPGIDGPLRIMQFEDRPALLYTEGLFSSGKLTQEKGEVANAIMHFNLIRASALPLAMSVQFIRTVKDSQYE